MNTATSCTRDSLTPIEVRLQRMDHNVIDQKITSAKNRAEVVSKIFKVLKRFALDVNRPVAVRDHALELLAHLHSTHAGVPLDQQNQLIVAVRKFAEDSFNWKAKRGVDAFEKAFDLQEHEQHGMGLRIPSQ